MPRKRAVSRASATSLKLVSRKPIEKDFTSDAGSDWHIDAASVEESTPPLSSTPSGTSLTSLIRTLSSTSAPSASAASFTDRHDVGR